MAGSYLLSVHFLRSANTVSHALNFCTLRLSIPAAPLFSTTREYASIRFSQVITASIVNDCSAFVRPMAAMSISTPSISLGSVRFPCSWLQLAALVHYQSTSSTKVLITVNGVQRVMLLVKSTTTASADISMKEVCAGK
ncbi:hypothetical protein [Rheinheimera riviphila]|uniref:hypothetical protein n=1 Tax=Rheinheimera riviphila TaxID=1834037 RepID=UPI0013E3B560|nr:hypothetical protein [Rheinheimera riviphila]